MEKIKLKKLVLTAVFAAVAVVGSLFSFPVFGSKCAPVQHLINVLCAVILGPGYGVAAAFVSSLIRNLLGLGTLLAFPGSMCGALLAGLLYQEITCGLYRRGIRNRRYRRDVVISCGSFYNG